MLCSLLNGFWFIAVSKFVVASVTAGSFFTDFSSRPSNLTTDGIYSNPALFANPLGIAAVSDGVLRVSRGDTYHTQSSAFFALTSDNIQGEFDASFSLRLWNPGPNAWNPSAFDMGDGVAFVLGDPSSGPLVNRDGDYAEGGLNSGLAVSFDAWDIHESVRGVVTVRNDGEQVSQTALYLEPVPINWGA